MFDKLSIDNIIKIYYYMLTDCNVLLYSSSRQLLFFIMEAFKILTFPLESSKNFISNYLTKDIDQLLDEWYIPAQGNVIGILESQ